mmetsp:Transcript_5253/g.14453  ORF Transcript_5253/g.14453 Transcript_5253/m.14453 type:complete len:215 (+) Transcript_5253:819-1463(+)
MHHSFRYGGRKSPSNERMCGWGWGWGECIHLLYMVGCVLSGDDVHEPQVHCLHTCSNLLLLPDASSLEWKLVAIRPPLVVVPIVNVYLGEMAVRHARPHRLLDARMTPLRIIRLIIPRKITCADKFHEFHLCGAGVAAGRHQCEVAEPKHTRHDDAATHIRRLASDGVAGRVGFAKVTDTHTTGRMANGEPIINNVSQLFQHPVARLDGIERTQ